MTKGGRRMNVPKDARLAIAIGLAAAVLFTVLGVYGIYYFFTGGCDEDSEPYTAYEVREKIEKEYGFPIELEYLGETVTRDKPWKRVDYAFRDKERDFTFTAHAEVAPINASIPFIILPGGRSYYTDYPARCLDRLNDEVQKCAKKRGLRFATPEEKEAHLSYGGGLDTVFLADEKQLADAAELFLDIARIYNVARFGEHGAQRDIAFCYLPLSETDLKKAQLICMMYLRGKRDIYDANGIAEYNAATRENDAEPFLRRLKSGWQDKSWRAKKKAAESGGVGMSPGGQNEPSAPGSLNDRTPWDDWGGADGWDDWDNWGDADGWDDWDDWGDERSDRPEFLTPPVSPSRREPSWI